MLKPWTCYWRSGEAISLLTVDEDLPLAEVAFVFALLRIAFAQMSAER